MAGAERLQAGDPRDDVIIEGNLPAAMKMQVAYDATIVIRESIQEVLITIGEAALIVMVVIFLFMGSLRSVLIPVITILFILRIGDILDAGFDQIFNMYNPLVYEVSDIVDTYVYRVGLIDRRYDFSAAIGLFKNIVGVVLLLGSNAIIKRFSEYGIW